jgi:hypothetical protein
VGIGKRRCYHAFPRRNRRAQGRPARATSIRNAGGCGGISSAYDGGRGGATRQLSTAAARKAAQGKRRRGVAKSSTSPGSTPPLAYLKTPPRLRLRLRCARRRPPQCASSPSPAWVVGGRRGWCLPAPPVSSFFPSQPPLCPAESLPCNCNSSKSKAIKIMIQKRIPGPSASTQRTTGSSSA